MPKKVKFPLPMKRTQPMKHPNNPSSDSDGGDEGRNGPAPSIGLINLYLTGLSKGHLIAYTLDELIPS